VFRLSGGPGLSNMRLGCPSALAAHDVILVGYRGVDGSVRLDAPEVAVAASGTTPAATVVRTSRSRGGTAWPSADRWGRAEGPLPSASAAVAGPYLVSMLTDGMALTRIATHCWFPA